MENRKLAAILAADIVGYSRLAGADEERTLIRLRSLRSEFLDPTIQVNNGRVVKRIGDGLIVEFRSVVDATRCAVEIQRGMRDRNASAPPKQELQFRIGVHVGDVVEEADGDLMGDAVNIAARLEGVAKPGAICLSEDAYRQVRNRLSLSIDDLGLKRMKNIAEPIRVYSVAVEAAKETSGSRKTRSGAPVVATGLLIMVLGVAAAVGGLYVFVRGGPRPAPQIATAPAAAPSPKATAPSAPPAPSPKPPTTAAATLEDANAEYARGHYEKAFRLYSELATDRSDASAEGNLGEFYRRGLGVQRDYELARRWFRKAADQGDPIGQNGLGLLYENGLGVERDYAQALQWFRKSADQNYAWGQANLGVMYKNGWGLEADYDAALRSFKAAASQNNPLAQNGIGMLYENGWGVEQDFAQAFDWYSRSAKQDYAWGMANLGYLYARGAGVAESCDQAKAWFSKALASGGQDVRDYLISHEACEFDASAQ